MKSNFVQCEHHVLRNKNPGSIIKFNIPNIYEDYNNVCCYDDLKIILAKHNIKTIALYENFYYRDGTQIRAVVSVKVIE